MCIYVSGSIAAMFLSACALHAVVADVPEDLRSGYLDAQRRLREHFVTNPAHVRPSPKHGRGGFATSQAAGGRFVRPPADRLVPEADDKERHVEAALRAEIPSRAARAHWQMPSDLKASIAFAAAEAGRLPALRRGRQRVLADVASGLEPLERFIRVQRPQPSHVAEVASRVHVALLCCIVDAMEWPDIEMPLNFLRGFDVLGDIADSGVYRPLPERLSLDEFSRLYNGIMETNEQWLSEVTHMLSRRAERSSASDLESLEAATRKEVERGHIGPAMTEHELRRRFTRDGRLVVRVLPRFGVWQGEKLRPIDDGKVSLSNQAQRHKETITTPSFEFSFHVLDELARECIRRGIPIPECELGLDDIAAAYRVVPTSQPEFTVAAVWYPSLARVVFHQVHGHPFGLATSVTNFNRVPECLCAFARRFFAAAVDHFFDDYMCVDLASARGSAQHCLDFLHNAVRFPLEPRKRKHSSAVNVALGIEADLSKVSTCREVSYRPTPERVTSLVARLQAFRAARSMSPGEAASLLGSLGFTLTAAYGGVGRAAVQPLIQREHYDGHSGWTAALDAMCDYFIALLPRLPELRLQLGARAGGHLLVYTDASHSPSFSGLGVVVFDTARGRRFISECRLPPWVFSLFASSDHVINQAELLAMVAARLTFPDVFYGRSVLHFVDNTSALSAAVHGYSSKPDMAVLTNMLHSLDASLRVDAFYEWVPSDANIADIPSRNPSLRDAGACGALERLGLIGDARRAMRLPSPPQWRDLTPLLDARAATRDAFVCSMASA